MPRKSTDRGLESMIIKVQRGRGTLGIKGAGIWATVIKGQSDSVHGNQGFVG